MASTRPACFLGMPQGAGIAVGAPADLVLLSRDDGRVRLEETYKDGTRVERRAGGG
jgi:dihydroorotase-like cyclic amidohydrolase